MPVQGIERIMSLRAQRGNLYLYMRLLRFFGFAMTSYLILLAADRIIFEAKLLHIGRLKNIPAINDDGIGHCFFNPL